MPYYITVPFSQELSERTEQRIRDYYNHHFCLRGKAPPPSLGDRISQAVISESIREYYGRDALPSDERRRLGLKAPAFAFDDPREAVLFKLRFC